MPDPTAPDGSPYATREQIVRIASRLMAAYLLFWVIDDITILPREIFAIAHYMHFTGSILGINTRLPETSYDQRAYILDLLANILRMALWLLGAGWFYRCGPRIFAFFCPPEPANPELTNS